MAQRRAAAAAVVSLPATASALVMLVLVLLVSSPGLTASAFSIVRTTTPTPPSITRSTTRSPSPPPILLSSVVLSSTRRTTRTIAYSTTPEQQQQQQQQQQQPRTEAASRTPPPPKAEQRQPQEDHVEEVEEEYIQVKPVEEGTDEWELDCYSRPVLVNGKKLWEVLLTDSSGSFRYRKAIPSNQVNSKTVRGIVEDVMDRSTDTVKPNIIRFFRGAMFNMINIALSELPDVTSQPSRCTFQLAAWLEQRHAEVYPKMKGYNANMAASSASGSPSFLNVRTAVKLPDALRGERYAFVALPLAEFLPGGSVTNDNIGVGRLCPLPSHVVQLPGDAFVQGVVILTQRAKALASWMAGTEVVALSADLRKRQLTVETAIDTQYLMAKLDDQQRAEGAAFCNGKEALAGLHFLSVQRSEDDETPAGFWLLRELPNGI